MTARVILLDFVRGVWDSLQAVRYIFTIDQRSTINRAIDVPTEMDTTSSTSDPPPPPRRALTVLELRRQKTARDTNTPIAPQRSKPIKEHKHALKTILWLIGCNLSLILSMASILWLSGLSTKAEVKHGWKYTLINLTTTVLAIVLFVLHCVMRFFNCLWFSDVSQVISSTYEESPQRKGRSFSANAADFVIATVIDLLFFAQSFVSIVLSDNGLLPPLPAYLIQQVQLCLLMSLYSFEYNWMETGRTLEWRQQRMSDRWVYMLGYGLPITLLSNYMAFTFAESNAMWQMIAGQCTFAAAFPLTVTAAYFAPDPPSLNAPLDHQYYSLPLLNIVTNISQRLGRGANRWALGDK